MKSYHRLTLELRYQIQALNESGLGVRKISEQLLRSPSTISRELRRLDGKKYVAEKAQGIAEKNRQPQRPLKKITGDLQLQIENLLSRQWSPEQISGRLARQKIKISYETIYKHIYLQTKLGKDLHTHLRRKRRWRRSHVVSRNLKGCGRKKNVPWIEKRPRIVEARRRVGDYERDTVLGKNGRLLTIVDRTSRLTKIGKMERHNSSDTHYETLRLLSGLKVHTITNDNGPEFGLHDETAKKLNAEVFFTHPYCAWQRGTNENTNGLIRQYYPKGTDFAQVTAAEIEATENLLNNRPRKCLGYKTPFEVHQKLSQGVALGP